MRKAIITSVLLAVILGACGTTEATGPPEINYGRDICENCGMSIDDERFAAGYRLSDGTERVFDDLGGLLVYINISGELDDAEVWVHDFETEMWVRSDDAFFVPTSQIDSPMGFGILSFADEARATSFAAGAGDDVLRWSTVITLPTDVRRPGDANPTSSTDMPGMTDTTEHNHSDS